MISQRRLDEAMKITKKEFFKTMTSSLTYFAGVTRRRLLEDEVYCKLEDLFQPDTFIDLRSCAGEGKDLAFSDDSHLSLYPGSEYARYDYCGNSVLMVTYPEGKTMYYIIRAVDEVNDFRERTSDAR